MLNKFFNNAAAANENGKRNQTTHTRKLSSSYTVPCKSSDKDVDMGDDTGKESKETERLLLLFVMATGKDDGRGIFYFREFLTATTL